ncbi:MAG: tetratricopeptide repeat protein, partial [Bacteroidia bacterium]
LATKEKSAADFSNNHVYDSYSMFHYTSFFNDDNMFIKEFELNKTDTLSSRTEKVDFIIGSGQHTNSHLQIINGYVNQMPMTYYTQTGKWDLPPGFENGSNTRFSRKIGLECMTCHNGLPDFVMGSENRYTNVPNGIDCERCHGPGSLHVKRKMNGDIIDTSKYIDYSIVNPSKLSIDRQFDICQRCHLQGNIVLKEGKSFLDFKPGMKLNDFQQVYLPRFTTSDDEFIMASHVDRLKQSACFIKSKEKSSLSNSLKPYKDALTCVTCHNPHVSVKQTNTEIFNNACKNCHNENGNSKLNCTDKHYLKYSDEANIASSDKRISCVNCHMPKSGSIDIPHVTVHDHYIRKPVTKSDKKAIKKFVGLYCINDSEISQKQKIRAYLQQYEKFEQQQYYLDTLELLFSKIKNPFESNLNKEYIQLLFYQNKYNLISESINKKGLQTVLNSLQTKSYDNYDAWVSYRIGESYFQIGDIKSAAIFYKNALSLAPFIIEFQNKTATAIALSGKQEEAFVLLQKSTMDYPKNAIAQSNLGYIYLTKGNTQKALEHLSLAVKLDPHYENAWLNLSAYYLSKNQLDLAKNTLNKVLSLNPKNKQALDLLNRIKN